jgi:hypothetical protein
MDALDALTGDKPDLKKAKKKLTAAMFFFQFVMRLIVNMHRHNMHGSLQVAK